VLDLEKTAPESEQPPVLSVSGRNSRKSTTQRFDCAGVTFFVVFLVALMVPPSHADNVADTFPASEYAYSENFGNRVTPYSALSNDALVIRAEQLRDSPVSTNPQVMNYRWLSQQSDQTNALSGGRAISKLVERQLKDYIESHKSGQWLRQKLMPDGNGQGFIKDVDYILKLRSDELVIGLDYEF
jgi:hypothetical protein